MGTRIHDHVSSQLTSEQAQLETEFTAMEAAEAQYQSEEQTLNSIAGTTTSSSTTTAANSNSSASSTSGTAATSSAAG